MEQKKKTIVILGAGFGGIRAALSLEKIVTRAELPNIRIVLVDKNRYHTYIPALYEVASAAPQVSEDALYHRVNILIKHLVLERRIEFIKAEVASLEVEPQYISFTDGNGIDFDYLVIALGAQTNFYNVKGLKEHAIDLKDFVSALKIRRAVKLADEIPRSIVLGGGGTTGVELAAELRTCFQEEELCPGIAIIEGADRILPGFPEEISRLASRRLRELGITVIRGSYIKKVEKNILTLTKGKTLPYDEFFWMGGIKAHSLLDSLPFQKEKGFLEVSSCLQVLTPRGEPIEHIFAIGDTSVVYTHQGEQIPWTAQKAITEGEKIAQNIFLMLTHKETKVCIPEPIRFIIPIGGKWAITKLNSITYAGFWGWVLKNLVELKYLASILPWHKALIRWIRAVVTFSRND